MNTLMKRIFPVIAIVLISSAVYYSQDMASDFDQAQQALSTDLNSLLYGAIGVLTCFSVAYLSSTIIPTKVERLTGLNIYDVPKPTH